VARGQLLQSMRAYLAQEPKGNHSITCF